jgi:hypothetical protein
MLFYGALKPFIELSAFEIFATHLQQVRVGCRHFRHQRVRATKQFEEVMKNRGFNLCS